MVSAPGQARISGTAPLAIPSAGARWELLVVAQRQHPADLAQPRSTSGPYGSRTTPSASDGTARTRRSACSAAVCVPRVSPGPGQVPGELALDVQAEAGVRRAEALHEVQREVQALAARGHAHHPQRERGPRQLGTVQHGAVHVVGDHHDLLSRPARRLPGQVGVVRADAATLVDGLDVDAVPPRRIELRPVQPDDEPLALALVPAVPGGDRAGPLAQDGVGPVDVGPAGRLVVPREGRNVIQTEFDVVHPAQPFGDRVQEMQRMTGDDHA